MENHKITPIEKKILKSLHKGRTNSQIAQELFISVNTVKYHLKNIYRKLGAANRVEAIIKSNNFKKTTEL